MGDFDQFPYINERSEETYLVTEKKIHNKDI